MKSDLNRELVSTIKKKLPANINGAVWLSEILNIGIESAYRRLRGEISFTFDEVALISSKLNFSIDFIIKNNHADQPIEEFQALPYDKHLGVFHSNIEEYSQMLSKINKQDGHVRLVANVLPNFFAISKPTITKFRFYKWFYTIKKKRHDYTLSDFIIPDSFLSSQKKFKFNVLNIPRSTIILDDNIFVSFIKEVNYYYKRNLILLEELEQIRQELFEILDEIEDLAVQGKNKNGGKIDIYLSSIDLESTYMYVDIEGEEPHCQLRLYTIYGVDIQSSKLKQIQKEWMDSLKKFSVLITESGELQRAEFVKKQHDLISKMGQ